jgi:hypothetical protein
VADPDKVVVKAVVGEKRDQRSGASHPRGILG